MSREIFINIASQEKRVAILENKRIEEFYIERADSVNLVGNIYKGRVESVLPGIDAAFVNLGLEKNGFLYVTDVVPDAAGDEEDKVWDEEPAEPKPPQPPRDRRPDKKLPSITQVLKKGDEVLVQVVKEPISTKGARLTTHISIPGRFLVLMPFETRIGLSKRIEDPAERERIRTIMKGLNLPKDVGFIVRTAAIGVSQRDFQRESRNLIRLWANIKHRAHRARPPQLIHKEYDIVLRVTRDIFTSDVAKLEIDSKDQYSQLHRFLRDYSPQLRPRLKLYRDRTPLFEKYDIERQIDKIYERMVQLKSGGYLVFDETESLVAIDVNSGKSVGMRNLEETAFRTNLEAAEEIARQLRLRDVGGIIIIDFIDMELSGHRKAVLKALERAIEVDKAKNKILNISSIGIVEMTRQRMRKSVESKSHDRCPYCMGRGMIKSPATISIELARKLEYMLSEPSRSREVFVSLHPDVASYVATHAKEMVRGLERRFRKTIRVIEDQQLHREEIKVELAR